jgi:hypothetical protein
MKEILYLGKEVKNSWGTVATNDQFIKAKPKLMHGFMRALLKTSEPGLPGDTDTHVFIIELKEPRKPQAGGTTSP